MKFYFFSKITYKTLCFLLFLDFLKITFYPSTNLIYWCASAILLDLLSGIFKSLAKGDFLVSNGLRKTIKKFAQYIGTVLLLFIFSNVFTHDPEATKRALDFFGDNIYNQIHSSLEYINNLVLLIIVYTELLSISENLIAIDHTSGFSRWVLKPIHRLLSLAIINNTFNKASNKMQGAKNNTKTK